MKLIALMTDTFREIYARKVILGIIIIEILTLAITALILGWTQGTYEAARAITPPQRTTLSIEQEPMSHEDSLTMQEDSALLALGRHDTTAGNDSLNIDSAATAPSRTFTVDPSNASPQGIAQASENAVTEIVRGQLGAFSIPLAIAVFVLGIFATAGIIPSMMEKGTIDLLLSKPVSRPMLLFGRALGGIVAVIVNLVFFVLGLWAIYGAYSGIWYIPFLIWTPLIIFFGYLVLYSFIILVNVLAESWVLPMSLVYIHIFLFSAFLTNRQETLFILIENSFVRTLLDGLYYILPQTADYVKAVAETVFTGNAPEAAPFIQGSLFIIVMLSLAAWKFERKDF